ncbi:hypothetical protein QJS10_CPA08g00631 [Acorus calamus]|uniref:Uncharacterized protein n=1 Tax=Acorus calamus TaxID=4465 RepID=A0AAV9EDC1_ACOCL|nr:hypothetical protein QJS10_CPA08g00631 [Acorus calamus]
MPPRRHPLTNAYDPNDSTDGHFDNPFEETIRPSIFNEDEDEEIEKAKHFFDDNEDIEKENFPPIFDEEIEDARLPHIFYAEIDEIDLSPVFDEEMEEIESKNQITIIICPRVRSDEPYKSEVVHPRGFTDPVSYIDLVGISSDRVRRWSDDDDDSLQVPRYPSRHRRYLRLSHQCLEQQLPPYLRTWTQQHRSLLPRASTSI